jgi:putative transposase
VPGVDGGMESYKRGSHTVWDCKYHLVWVTKYRYQILGGDVGERCRELLRETAQAHEMVVHAGSINRDHVHMLLSIPPGLSVSRAVQYLKGRSSYKLLAGSPACANATGVSTCGHGAIGLQAVAT